jgi:ribosomal-protein-serine acetyltransferase
LPWITDTNSVFDTIKFIERANHLENSRNGLFVIVKLKSNFIGVVGATRSKEQPELMKINYWIDSDFCNKGYASSVVNLLIEFIAKNWGVTLFNICVSIENKPSIRVAEKLVFIKIKTIKKAEFLNGRWHSNFIFEKRIYI